MENIEFTKWLITLGVGGVLAGFMFVFYRKDVRQYTQLWQTQTVMLLDVVRQNTIATTANTEMIRAMHTRLDIIDGNLAHSRRP